MSGSKRDRIQEIRDRKSRDTETSASTSAHERLEKVFMEMHNLVGLLGKETVAHQVFRFMPVSLVAIVQTYFHKTIANLIDEEGGKYRDNAHKLKAKMDLSIDHVLAISGRAITAGDLIADAVKMNRIEDIFGAMGTLIGSADFYDELKRQSDKDTKRYDFNYRLSESLYANMKEIFRVRHIVCHEHGDDLAITSDDVFDWWLDTNHLILTTNSIISTEKMDRLIPHRVRD